MICSVSGISARSPRDSGHAPRYDEREPGSIPPPDLAASRLAPTIRQQAGRDRTHCAALKCSQGRAPVVLLLDQPREAIEG
jgi:hypothetical protein